LHVHFFKKIGGFTQKTKKMARRLCFVKPKNLCIVWQNAEKSAGKPCGLEGGSFPSFSSEHIF